MSMFASLQRGTVGVVKAESLRVAKEAQMYIEDLLVLYANILLQ